MSNHLPRHFKYCICLVLISIIPIGGLKAGGTHIHGQASISVVLDEKNLIVHATISAYDVVGFERHPETEVEKQEIKAALHKLTSTQHWIILEQGHCTKKYVNFVNPFAADKNNHSEHYDFEVTATYTCQKAENLSEIKIILQEIYSQIQSIEVQWLLHNKQGIEHLDMNKSAVRLR